MRVAVIVNHHEMLVQVQVARRGKGGCAVPGDPLISKMSPDSPCLREWADRLDRLGSTDGPRKDFNPVAPTPIPMQGVWYPARVGDRSEVFPMERHGRNGKLTREELYEQVWSTPMRKLGPTYGLSDVGLKRFCKKHGIPTPPVGYRVKKELGKKVRRTPLPPSGGSRATISLVHDPDPAPRSQRPGTCPISDPDSLERYSYERSRQPRRCPGSPAELPPHHPADPRGHGRRPPTRQVSPRSCWPWGHARM
jgi:hypothetical protein